MNPSSAQSQRPLSHEGAPPSEPAIAHSTGSPAWLLWIGLAVALSPAAYDLVRHWTLAPWSRYSLVFLVLFAVCARRERRPPARWPGAVWIGAGLALEVVAAFTGAIRWARPGLLMAALGMCHREGIASWRTRALLLFALPVPAVWVRIGSGIASHPIAGVVADLARAAGLSATAVGRELQVGDGLIWVGREWLALVPLLGGLAWYDAIRSRRPLGRALVLCALATPLALPIQMLALGLAVAVASTGAPGAAQMWLDHGLWLAVAAAGIVGTEWRVRWHATASR